MCLAALALDLNRHFPLVLASNRDEYFDRPAARLGWWRPRDGGPEILAGRDLQAGGTWLGLSAAGRLALLTNIREPLRLDPRAPSRGRIVPEWLAASEPPDRFWVRTALGGHNGYNLIAADFASGDCHWMSSRRGTAQRLGAGLYGVSNGLLDEPWPKVVRLKRQMALALSESNGREPARRDHRARSDAGSSAVSSAEALANRLFLALADRQVADDAELPSTGVPLLLERALSPVFIRTADGRYGTRCSTVIVAERVGRSLVTQVFERTHPVGGGVALMRRALLRDWPPRYHTEPRLVPLDTRSAQEQHPVDDAAHDTLDLSGPAVARSFEDDLPDEPDGAPAMPGVRLVRPRVRSLLRP